MAHVVILGAGLTGLSTAYHLEKKGFFDYQIFEKDSTIGGLCRSITQDGFTFDYTGHLIHASDAYFREFINQTIGYEALGSIERRSYIYSHETYTKYPFQMNLFGLPPHVISDCIKGFACKKRNSNPKTFYDWVLTNFGAGIADHFFFPFQRKIFSYPLKKVTPTWMGRFVPNTSLEKLIAGAIQPPVQSEAIGYNAHFYYPHAGGINAWVTSIAHKLQNSILTGFAAQRIDLKKRIIYFANGESEPFQTLISTIPLDIFLTHIDEPTNSNLSAAANKLICNSVVNFNLGIAQENISDKHWIYFPEAKYPFYRIGFAHNFARRMAPAGCSSLYGEFSHIKASPKTIKRKLDASISATKDLLKLHSEQIITQAVIPIKHAYVIYDTWREKYLPKLHAQLSELNVFSIGRYGEWKYSSMQEAILDGKKIADQIAIIPAQRIYESVDMPTNKTVYEQTI